MRSKHMNKIKFNKSNKTNFIDKKIIRRLKQKNLIQKSSWTIHKGKKNGMPSFIWNRRISFLARGIIMKTDFTRVSTSTLAHPAYILLAFLIRAYITIRKLDLWLLSGATSRSRPWSIPSKPDGLLQRLQCSNPEVQARRSNGGHHYCLQRQHLRVRR